MELIKNSALGVILVLSLNITGFAEPPTAGAIDRGQEMIRQDELIRQEMQKEKKFFVSKIVIHGPLKLSDKELRDIVGTAQESWMAKEDVDQILHTLRVVYVKRGANNNRLDITQKLTGSGVLEITVRELTQ